MVNPRDIGMTLGEHEITGAQQTCKVGGIFILQNTPERFNDFVGSYC